MPNNYKTHLHIKADDKKKKMVLDAIKSKTEDDRLFDFNRVIPMPSDLHVDMYADAQYYVEGHIKNKTVPDFNVTSYDCLGSKRDCTHMEEAKLMWQNYLKYGYIGWYGWAYDHWGTKWNAYDCDAEEFGLTYETANGDSRNVVVILSAMFPDVEFYMEWANEDIGRACGSCTIIGGNITEIYLPDIMADKETAKRFACKVWDYDYDEYFSEE